MQVIGDGHCSCAYYLQQKEGEIGEIRQKYVKRGWSEAKIARAVADRKPRGYPGGLHPEVRRWLGEAAKAMGEELFVVHWEGLADESSPAVVITVEEILDPAFQVMPETVYRIMAV